MELENERNKNRRRTTNGRYGKRKRRNKKQTGRLIRKMQ